MGTRMVVARGFFLRDPYVRVQFVRDFLIRAPSETFLSLFPFGQRSFLSEYSTKINHMSANREEGDGNLWPKSLWWRWTSDESVTLTKDASDQKVYDKGFSDERVSDELAFHQRVTPLGRRDRLPHHILNLEFQSDESRGSHNKESLPPPLASRCGGVSIYWIMWFILILILVMLL